MNCNSSSFLDKTICALLFVAFYFLYSSNAYAGQQFVKLSYPVFTPGLNYWDSYHVQNPSILKHNLSYQLWFETNGGPGKRIGYASSPDGLSNWSRNPLPIVTVGSLDGWEKETAEPFVMYDALSGYKMWYTSFNSDHWTSGRDRFRLQYATSSTNTTWVKYPEWSLFGSSGNWDSGGVYKGKSILYLGDKYHLWYGGTNEAPLGSNAYWGIGYATSIDGIHWEKQNQGNPVITPTDTEPKNASYPTVLYDGGIFHMFYGTGSGDDPNQIFYCYSLDGIVWVRPPDINPVLTTGPNVFDALNITPFTVLKENETLKMWYSGYGIDGHWRIGYATAPQSILSTPDPNTIPTAAPTPTPTPSPPPTRKVVVIPGMTASWNPDALLNCKSDSTEPWTLFHLARPVYEPLLEALETAGWLPILYPYDWRKPIDENGSELTTYINTLTTETNEKVAVVGHSMGGLLARSHIIQEKWSNKLEKFLSVGSPHLGTVTVYPTWESGQIWEGSLGWKFLLTLLKKSCGVRHQTTDREIVQSYFPSVNNLLPIFDYLTNNSSGEQIHYSNMSGKNNFLTSSFANFYGTTVATLRGGGYETTTGYRIGPLDKRDSIGDWMDGKPISRITSLNGDGTVLLTSAEIAGANNDRIISVSHTKLMSSNEGISQILDFLGVAPQMHKTLVRTLPNPTSEPASGLFIIGYPADFWILDPDGHIIKDERNLQFYPNPKSGSYRLILTPKSDETRLIVAHFLSNGKIIWKEYQLKNRHPKIKTINFNHDNQFEVVL